MLDNSQKPSTAVMALDRPDVLTSKAPPAARRWWHWHEPGTTKEEKWLIFKLDFFILLYSCLTFFIKYLDQTNVTNAYVSGMKEDLSLGGSDLNWLTTYFNIGIMVGGPFITMALTVTKPRYLLPTCTVIWSFFVLFMYKVQDIKTLYILRFFAGLFESGAMPGAFYMIGSWYRSTEISRRSAFYWFASIGGGMFSGYIQAGLYENMNGKLGLASWRWVFIFDFIIGLPIAIFGFFCCPDEPTGERPWWMTEREQAMSIKRIDDENRDVSVMQWNSGTVKRILSSWQFYAFVLSWGFMECTCGVNLQRWMTLYLQSLKVDGRPRYSNQKINSLPTVIGCVELAWLLISSTLADFLNVRAPIIAFLGLAQLTAYVVFYVWSENVPLMMGMYYLCSAYGAVSPLISAWLNSSCGGDRQLRALTTSLMISIGYAVETVSQQFMFPTSEAPRFERTHGYAFGIGWVIVMIVWCGLLLPLVERHFSKRRLAHPGSC
ncbi:MFS general substrate transporter [Aspergillus aculeatinus CBS 121060]|uniref:MFS general substrate transporter n=1 Tax=Aspergillus aculeatinus CBS 121060 TaxID=1448322 RepID=A0ACD1GX19_9EURO|nr:MFS general substrate transporter [Aspergillus aculeatinus CBS 121060]RAH65874.1 MFS general substrate transporter [Aspergillus aculeatinus CBS 121060]